MDLVLDICDELILDRLWSSLVPASAFLNIPQKTAYPLNSTLVPSPLPRTAWASFVSSLSLPHPPLSVSSNFTSFASSSRTSAWPRDYILRQTLSLSLISFVGIIVLYFLFAGFSYYFIFNHDMMRHPRFIKNQVKLEIVTSLGSFPGMTALTVPCFLGEVRGYSRLYNNVDEYGWAYFFFSIAW